MCFIIYVLRFFTIILQLFLKTNFSIIAPLKKDRIEVKSTGDTSEGSYRQGTEKRKRELRIFTPFPPGLWLNRIFLKKSIVHFTGCLQDDRVMGIEKIVKIFFVLGCSLLLLTACASKKPDFTKSAGAGRGKASQRPYTVNGHTYEPLQTHVGFAQTGIASWYGKDFHGKTTSNGERYDMHAMTAAHKTLPLGVFVKVQNRENGREAVVRVNDRGPFVRGRIIDLSYAAAKQLGIDLAGTGSVRVEALGYRADGKGGYKSPESYDSGNYTVQIGSFKEYSNAKRLGSEMNNLFGFSDVRMTSVTAIFSTGYMPAGFLP